MTVAGDRNREEMHKKHGPTPRTTTDDADLVTYARVRPGRDPNSSFEMMRLRKPKG